MRLGTSCVGVDGKGGCMGGGGVEEVKSKGIFVLPNFMFSSVRVVI